MKAMPWVLFVSCCLWPGQRASGQDVVSLLDSRQVDWSTWEVEVGDKTALLRRLLGDCPNFNQLAAGFHFVDFSGDGIVDLIYSGPNYFCHSEVSDGTHSVLYESRRGELIQVALVNGLITGAWRAGSWEPITFLVREDGCCGDRTTYYWYLHPRTAGNGNTIYRESQRTSLVRDVDLPEVRFNVPRPFTVRQEQYNLRRSARIEEDNIIAAYGRGASGVALGEATGPEGRVWWFVVMDSSTSPLALPDRNLRLVGQIAGWVSSRFVDVVPQRPANLPSPDHWIRPREISEQSNPRLTGIYSDMHVGRGFGDISGTELFLFRLQNAYRVLVHSTRQGRSGSVLTEARVRGMNLTFEVPPDSRLGHLGSFSGIFEADNSVVPPRLSLRGTFGDSLAVYFSTRRRDNKVYFTTWEVANTSRWSHKIARRYTLTEDDLLLRESFETRGCECWEDWPVSATVEVWPIGAEPAVEPLRTIRAPAGDGGTSFSAYEVGVGVSGGPEGLGVFYSLQSGEELFSSSAPVLRVKHPATGQRLIGLHSNYAAWSPPEYMNDRSVVAVLQYGDGRTPSARVIVTGREEYYRTEELRFVVDGVVREAQDLDLAASSEAESVPITGFSVRAELDNPFGDAPDVWFEIPVIDDQLAIEQATMSEGIELRLGAPNSLTQTYGPRHGWR